jgi:hypothetical protein
MHRDQLSSVVLITNGNTAREENFLPFALSAAENIPLPAVAADAKGFIGERFDPDAGLQYLNVDPLAHAFRFPQRYLWLSP